MTVINFWKRIETWLAANAPDLRKSLRPPAKDAALGKLRAKLGMALPADLVESLQIHDGQKSDADIGLFPSGTWELGALPSFRLLSAAEIGREWKMMKELHDMGEFAGRKAAAQRGVRADWWNLAWIPIADDGGGDYMCLDLAPAKGGAAGQLILFFHDMDERRLLARSLAAWLTRLARGIETGKYEIDEDDGVVEV
jgi:cell wall assembly regulator SMI1